jgi:hypothetical protein
MRRALNPIRPALCVLCTIFYGVACASSVTTIAPRPPETYERLGPAEGQACGILMFLVSSLEFIPAGINSRVERAYDRAVRSVPGATALVDVTMEEDWSWLLGTRLCTKISGVAIK